MLVFDWSFVPTEVHFGRLRLVHKNTLESFGIVKILSFFELDFCGALAEGYFTAQGLGLEGFEKSDPLRWPYLDENIHATDYSELISDGLID